MINRILQTVALPQVNAVPQQGHSVPPVGAGIGAGANGRWPPRSEATVTRRRSGAVRSVTPSCRRPCALELTVKRKLDGVLQGNHLRPDPRAGFEPGESRLYQPGDDVRRMDWSVTARTTHPHVRQMIADRELETWLVVDVSASLDFGTTGCQKRDLAVAAAADHLSQQRRRKPAGRGDRQRSVHRAVPACPVASTSRRCCVRSPPRRGRRWGAWRPRRRHRRPAPADGAAGWRW